MKIAVILGTRPEVIKLAPVILKARERGHEVQVVFTGQHRQMALPLMNFFGIHPELDLEVMVPNQTLSGLSARVLEKLDALGESFRPDWIFVQGDTTSAWIAAYWAFCHKIPVAHVEAGLRTNDLDAPFPEEGNRQLITRIAHMHFAPTAAAVRALKKENPSRGKILQVGNSGIDALLYTLDRIEHGDIPDDELLPDSVMDACTGKKVVLVTAHRRESFGEPFKNLCAGIRGVADLGKDIQVIYPVHPNPNVRSPVEHFLGGHPRILLCDPLPYVAFIDLMTRASVLLTDSGGVQEEGPTLKKPILVMREKTERPEGVKAGLSKLVGTNPKKIIAETKKALKQGTRMKAKNPYGDGKAAERMIRAVEKMRVLSC